MNNKPLVSVITVSYNAGSSIENTIKSVIQQSYPNIEYIIIDGGSKDETVEIIKEYSININYWTSETDGGVYFGMNKGIAQSHGDWICFMNAGDRFANSEVLSNIFDCDIDFEKIGVILGDVILDYSPYGKVLKRFNNIQGEEQSINLCHQSSLTKGFLLREVQYDTSFRIFADINAFHEFWKRGVIFQYLPIPMAVFEGFDGISSTKPWLSFKESNRIIKYSFYNSIQWWRRVCIIIVKKIMETFMSEENYRKNKYNRIAAKNNIL